MTGTTAVKQKLFTSYVALSLSAVAMFFVSSMSLAAAWLIGSPTAGECTGLGTILCFDQVCWVLVAWCLGQSMTRWLKGRLSHPLTSLERCLYPRGYIRVVGEAGKLDLIPRALVQNGDVIVARPGETLWCDGIAQVSLPIDNVYRGH